MNAFFTSLISFALTASAHVSAYRAERSFGNLGLSLPLRILPISGKDLYTFTNDLNSPAAPFPTAGSISKSPPKSLLAISQLLGEGQAGEFLSTL